MYVHAWFLCGLQHAASGHTTHMDACFDHFAVPVMTAKHFLELCYLKNLLQGYKTSFCKVLYKPFARGNLLQGKVLLQGVILLQGLPFARLFMKKAWGKVRSTLLQGLPSGKIPFYKGGKGRRNPFARCLQAFARMPFCKGSSSFLKDLFQGVTWQWMPC